MIGVFDSGVGGLTAVKEIKQIVPHEHIIYIGDTARVPYGTRSEEIIIKYAKQNIRFLISKNVDMILVACGTVSAIALSELHSCFSVPIIGIVETAAECAINATRNGIIGVIGTTATIKSNQYNKHIEMRDRKSRVISIPCPLLVPLIENGFIEQDNIITNLVCQHYLHSIKTSGADTLILGCTHFPIVEKNIQSILPGIRLVNAGLEAVKKLQGLINSSVINSDKAINPFIEYYVTDNPLGFKSVASIFLQQNISNQIHKVSFE